MKRTLANKLTVLSGAAALALGAAACDVEEPEAGEDQIQDPALEDDGGGDVEG